VNILEAIVAERREDVVRISAGVPRAELERHAADRKHHSLAAKLGGPGEHVISEMKKASPSAGLLRPLYEPGKIARIYEQNGASGISVLTEPRHFMGDASHLKEVREEVELPILRKDFMCEVYQVYEAAAWGADVILLIIAALGTPELRDLYDAAMGCGLDVLAEAHTADEVHQALEFENAIVGVNSRNLKTLKTDLNVAMELGGLIPDSRLSVAESGIKSRGDIEMLKTVGYRGFLIGEVLMSQGDPGAKLRELLGKA
jgi:indole-3-glycerol phosphate synthase